jgi:phage-related protein
MKDKNAILSVAFYRTSLGKEPVREWLLSLDDQCKKLIGSDIKTVQYGWPLGMPLIKKVDTKNRLWEVRTNLPNGIARVLFTVSGNTMILLHGFIKKSQKLEKKDIDLAIKRKKDLS